MTRAIPQPDLDILGAWLLLNAPVPLRNTAFNAPILALLPLFFLLCSVIRLRSFASVPSPVLIFLLGFSADPGLFFLEPLRRSLGLAGVLRGSFLPGLPYCKALTVLIICATLASFASLNILLQTAAR